MTEGERANVLGRERDEVITGDAAREVDLRPELYTHSIVDVYSCGGESAVTDASAVKILHPLFVCVWVGG